MNGFPRSGDNGAPSLHRGPFKSLLAATANTRDLGGYPSLEGGMTVKNRIWRSDAPTVWNEADLKTLKEHGITTLVDMRTDEETARKPCAYSAEEGFLYRHIPIPIGSTPPATLEEVPALYLQIALQKETAAILRTIAEAGAGVLYCCAAGKDRTGVISALLLLCCGVDHRTIVSDYAVSREYNRIRLEQYLTAHPEVDRRAVLANETSMQEFIRLFLNRFGSTEAFFAQAGLAAGHLARIRGKLLDGPRTAAQNGRD